MYVALSLRTGVCQNAVIMQVFDPALSPAHTSCFENRNVAESKGAESSALEVAYIN